MGRAIRLKGGPARLIGFIHLSDERNENRGFWLGLPWQGHGLMTEACDTVTEFWFNGLGRDVLRVSKAVPNAASRRISEKQGARLVRIEERDFISGRYPSELWELARARTGTGVGRAKALAGLALDNAAEIIL